MMPQLNKESFLNIVSSGKQMTQDVYAAQISPVMVDILRFVQTHPKVCIGIFVFAVFDVMVLIKHFMEHESLIKLLLPLL